jgi:hypothetical protein
LPGDEAREIVVGISAHQRVGVVRAMAAKDEAPGLEYRNGHFRFFMSAAPVARFRASFMP